MDHSFSHMPSSLRRAEKKDRTSLWQRFVAFVQSHRHIIVFLSLLVVFTVSMCVFFFASVVFYEYMCYILVPRSPHPLDLNFNYTSYYKSKGERIKNDIIPSATVNYTALMSTVRLSKSQRANSHMEFEIVYTLPYLLPNYFESVYSIEAQVLSKNKTVLATSTQTYTTDIRFAVNAVLTYLFLYPLVALGVVRNGEVRRMPCFIQEDFLVQNSIETVHVILHNPSVILTDCHLHAHVATRGFRSYLQNHHFIAGVLFVSVSTLCGTVCCLVVAVIAGVKLNAWLRPAEESGSSIPVKEENEPVVKKEDKPVVKEEDGLTVKKEDNAQFDLPPSSDFAFTLMKDTERELDSTLRHRRHSSSSPVSF
ncbi:hypothetical protein AV274_3300 [Blastocystis sp. ATCC 50177/Nand II]|uniref:Seipin n=1 Tax=Blastocystis sp. subtype 1 (strain ATCC 50177 / NandII) TaxID=478820 RepID=A0A196SD66_BLAHN|nr:hypothetical protein AV274_3300 [Blastocystis sp. ATCC 50177/Nand II]